MNKNTNLKYVYNLEFPHNITELNLDDYKIERFPEYEKRHLGMMHLCNKKLELGYQIKGNYGSHQITAIVKEKNKKSMLPWNNKRATRLNDICFFLSLLTLRNVFFIDEKTHKTNPILIVDHRAFNYGGILRCSIPIEEEEVDKETLLPISESDRDEFSFLFSRDIGFAKTLNRVLALTSTQKWLEKYEKGYFLFLYKQAMQRMDIEPTFILCWILWEHLFAVLNKNKYSEKQLEKDIEGEKKIRFILNEYFSITFNSDSKKVIKNMAKARNKLVHFGQKPNTFDHKDMDLFIRATEYLICKTLNLTPSNVFNTSEKLFKFLKL